MNHLKITVWTLRNMGEDSVQGDATVGVHVCDTKQGSWFDRWLRFRRGDTMQCATIFRVGNYTTFSLPDTLFIYTFIQDVQRHLAVYNGINPKHTAIFSFLSSPQNLLILWPLVPKFVGSHPAEAVGFLGRKKSSARLPSEGK